LADDPLSPRTRAIIVNTPHNPSATVWSRAELQQLAALLVSTDVLVIADAVGQSTAGGILQRYGVVYEPAPQPGFVPSWFVPGMPTFCMARMARILEGSGYLPLTAHIGFNNDPEGDSHYTAEEAEAFEQAGHSVHVPETFFPRISTTGG
jgi:hypothetical protein